MSIGITEFYKKTLASQGVYCVATIEPNTGRTRQHYVESIDEIEPKINQLKAEQSNIYVAMSTFKGYSRNKDDAIFARSFYIDLDVDPDVDPDDEKKFKSKEEANNALDKFVSDVGLPQPTKLDSGRGMWGYWAFDRDIPIEEWLIYAKKFKELCFSKGLKIDPSVTAEAARIARAPDCLNYKTNPPSPTKVISDIINVYSFDEFKEFLGAEEPSIESILLQVQKGGLTDAEKKIRGLDNFETSFEKILNASIDGTGCKQIKHIYENQNDISYDLWTAALTVANKCVDGEQAIHVISEKHHNYSPEDTSYRASSFQGVYPCTAFATANPGGCDGCPHRGKITNPLALGQVFKAATDPLPYLPEEEQTEYEDMEFNVIDHVNNTVADPNAFFLPGSLFPFVAGANGGIYKQIQGKRNKDGSVSDPQLLLVCKYNVLPYRRLSNRIDGDCLAIRVTFPKDPPKDILFPMSNAGSSVEVTKFFYKNGIYFEQGVVNHFMEYLIRWGVVLSHENKADIMKTHMGWTDEDNRDGFVIGQKEYRKNGTVIDSPISPLTENVAYHCNEKGSFELWKQAANNLNTPGMELHAFVMLAGFASPLLTFSSTKGASICLQGEAGAAKTGAMFSCMSMWGNPEVLYIHAKNGATFNGLRGRMLTLGNLPLAIDEVTNIHAETMSDLIHLISTGKSRIKMQSSINAERALEESASLFAIMTSNKSIYDRLTEFKADPNGEVSRLIEFSIGQPAILNSDPTFGARTFEPMKQNFGHAGPKFIQAIFDLQNRGEIIRDYSDPNQKYGLRVQKWIDRFHSDYGFNAANRFYNNVVGFTCFAGDVCNEYDIVNLDVENIYTKITTEMNRIRSNVVQINTLDYENIISEFLNKNHASTLFMKDGRAITEPRNSLVVRDEADTNTVYISRNIFNNYLRSEVNVNILEFKKKIENSNIEFKEQRIRLNKGWKNSSADDYNVWTYSFKRIKNPDAELTE